MIKNNLIYLVVIIYIAYMTKSVVDYISIISKS